MTRCYGIVCFFPFCVAYAIVSHYGTIGFIYLFIYLFTCPREVERLLLGLVS